VANFVTLKHVQYLGVKWILCFFFSYTNNIPKIRCEKYLSYLRSGEFMVGCRVNLKENLKQSVSPTTVIFNGMRSRRMFMNGFSYPKCGEDVLQTKQVFVYAKFSI